MKYKIVLVPFPFDDLTANKVRPAVCLTDEIKPHNHIVLAFITSRVSASASVTDFVIDKSDTDFAASGLKVSSTVRLHRLMTVTKSIILRELGELSTSQQTEIENVFGDPLSDTFDDPDHSAEERRFPIIGHSENGKLLFVSHTDDGETVRIISAREPTRAEREAYEQG